MDVLEDGEDGTPSGLRRHQCGQRRERLPLVFLGRNLGHPVSTGLGNGEQRGECRAHLFDREALAFELIGQAGEIPIELALAVDPDHSLELLDHGMEGTARVVGRGLEDEASRLLPDSPAQLVDETRLANPGLSEDENRLTCPLEGKSPPLLHGLELLLAPHERREAGGRSERAACPDARIVGDAIDGDRVRDALEPDGIHARKDEVPAGYTLGCRADDDRSRVGDLLQPRRHVHGLPHGQGVTLHARSHLGHDHDARVDADTGGEAHFASAELGPCEPVDGADNVEPRTYGVDGVVALRVRIPEVGEHAVALVLGDVAVKALDHLGAGAVIRGDELAEILRIELLAECSRLDEIAEDNREMPALRTRQRLLLLIDALWTHGSPPWARDQNARALSPVLLAQLPHVLLRRRLPSCAPGAPKRICASAALFPGQDYRQSRPGHRERRCSGRGLMQTPPKRAESQSEARDARFREWPGRRPLRCAGAASSQLPCPPILRADRAQLDRCVTGSRRRTQVRRCCSYRRGRRRR